MGEEAALKLNQPTLGKKAALKHDGRRRVRVLGVDVVVRVLGVDVVVMTCAYLAIAAHAAAGLPAEGAGMAETLQTQRRTEAARIQASQAEDPPQVEAARIPAGQAGVAAG